MAAAKQADGTTGAQAPRAGEPADLSASASAKKAVKKAAGKTATKTAAKASKDSAKGEKKAAKKDEKSTAAKPPAKKAKKSAPERAAKAPKATEKKASGKKKAAKDEAPKKVTTKEKAARLVVKEDEAPWTKAELKEIRKDLVEEIETLTAEIAQSEREIQGLIRDGSDGSGDDQADAGAKTLEREHEITLANNAREILHQNERALEQIEAGTYGICESCGSPIGKGRLQAQPRATLCLTCKAKQERR